MDRLRFLHIPKTAGSTFTNCLADQYFTKRHFAFTGAYASDMERLMKLPEAKREKIELFTGHAPMMTGIDIVDCAKIITFLREPVSRVQSFIQHIAEGKSPEYLRGAFDLDSFLGSGIGDLSNLQTKMLINKGVSSSRSLIDAMSGSEAKDMALYNLLHLVTAFGIQEYFDESLILFTKSLHWSMPYHISVNRKNTESLIEYQQRHLDRIAELNSIDIELYSSAKIRFLNIVHGVDFDRAKLHKLKQSHAIPRSYRWILWLLFSKIRQRIWMINEVSPIAQRRV